MVDCKLIDMRLYVTRFKKQQVLTTLPGRSWKQSVIPHSRWWWWNSDDGGEQRTPAGTVTSLRYTNDHVQSHMSSVTRYFQKTRNLASWWCRTRFQYISITDVPQPFFDDPLQYDNRQLSMRHDLDWLHAVNDNQMFNKWLRTDVQWPCTLNINKC